MWAVNRAVVPHGIMRRLTEHAHQQKLESTVWLTPGQARFYFDAGVCRQAGVEVKIDLSEIFVRSVPVAINEVPETLRAKLLRECPLPSSQAPQLLVHQHGLRWTTPSDHELFAGLLFTRQTTNSRPLFVAPEVAEDLSTTRTAIVVNAQETTNPFTIDPTVAHREWGTNKTFAAFTTASLNLLMRQFEYRSMYWLHAEMVGRDSAIQPLANQMPHKVPSETTVPIVQVSTLSSEARASLEAGVPRYLIGKKGPIVRFRQKWSLMISLNLSFVTPPSRRARVESPDLWIAQSDLEMLGISPAVTVPSTLKTCDLFFNVEQVRFPEK